MLRQLHIPKRFEDKRINNYKTKTDENKKALKIIVEYISNFDKHQEKGDWLVLLGDYGLGKTHLALAAARECLKYYAGQFIEKKPFSTHYNGSPKALFITSSEMVQSIRDSYDSDNLDELALMKDYKTTRLLILDDLGAEKSSEWQQEKMYLILDYRYRELLPTIITTNLYGKEFKAHLSPRVFNRIIEATHQGDLMVGFKGENYRIRGEEREEREENED